MNISTGIPLQTLRELARALVRAPENEVRVRLSYLRLLSSINDRYQPPCPEAS